MVAFGEHGLSIGVGNAVAVTGTVNLGAVGLGGGTITTIRVIKNGAAASGTLNFHGGTLKSSTTPNTTFVSGLTAAYVYGEGAIIDDGGQTLTIPQPLIAPTGFGVSSIPLTSGGSGYLDTPLVTITGGVGLGATAIAQVDYSTGGATSGQVTNILITNPGSGYNNGDSLTISLFGGGGTGAAVGTPTFIANASGGLTKLGSGSINLTGGFNFTSISGSPGLGLAYAFNPATGILNVVTAAPAITGLQFTAQPLISGTSLTISGTNIGSGAVYLLTSTNVAAPLSTWQPVWTNVFSDNSSFTTNVPNAVNPAFDKQFYILSNTNN